jgi:DNA-binding GntR family transcriptional regulator
MQFEPDAFDRPNISDGLVRAVRAMIVDGRLAAGERINEVHLAASLKVSRTPLREALSRLTAEDAVHAVPRRGFFVKALSVSELEQLYDVRPMLDPEALRLSGLPSAKVIDGLEVINQQIARETDPEGIIEMDDLWHVALLRRCPNQVLVGMIQQLMMRTRRYELALMRDRPSAERATGRHEAIIAALRAGDLEAACAELKANMTHGREPIIAWLKNRLARAAA